MVASKPVFLTAKWCNLLVANYVVESELLGALVTSGTVLDKSDGQVFLSLVALRFFYTRILGIPTVPRRILMKST